MILIVESDEAICEQIASSLKRDSYPVASHTTASEALAASHLEPDLIIADITSAETKGIQLIQEYRCSFPHRLTPFILLSSSDDPSIRVRALDVGADGFLLKPLNVDVLRAEVRAILQKKTRYVSPTFYGDLSRFSFPKLMRFCATRAISGEIVISSATRHAKIQLRGGVIIPPETGETVDFLAGLFDLATGTCVVRVHPLDFKDIEDAVVPQSMPSPDREKPVGRLSVVRMDKRQFQVQTEMTTLPRDRIMTIVTLAGKIILKREGLPLQGTTRKELDALIESQHRAVEDEIRERVNPDVIKRIKNRELQNERFKRLYDAGCERYQEKDYKSALKNWEEASLISPGDDWLLLNLQIARKKLGLPLSKQR